MGITRTVGLLANGRDHQTIEAAINYFDSYSFTSNGGGECYIDIYPEGTGTDGEWITTTLTSGPTSPTNISSTNHLVIRAAPGYGFADHADKETNALRYNPANGVAIRLTGNNIVLRADCSHVHFRGLQLKNSYASPTYPIIRFNTLATSGTVSGCILTSSNLNAGNAINGVDCTTAGAYTIVNNLFYKCRLTIKASSSGSISVHNTVYADAANASHYVFNAGGSAIVANCIAYSSGTDDFSLGTDATYSSSGITSANNASDDGTGPATGIVDALLSDEVVSVTAGSEDFRLADVPGSPVVSGGLDASSITTVDILGRPRYQGVNTASIGCWEIASLSLSGAELLGEEAAFSQGSVGVRVVVRL